MSLITQEYARQNAHLFEAYEDYGTSGKTWAKIMRPLIKADDSVLDYGCGRCTLEKALGFYINKYDPCVPEFSARPDPADFVACTDVLEHIEPECLDDVLDDLQRVTRRAGYFVIATRPAAKTLPDGRNAHLIIESPEWWLPKLWNRFRIVQFTDVRILFTVIVRPR